ncbi:MAG: STAS domain-containing protein [Bacteroidetes bacterium]|nr:STAS domain-containing protein [Bacteroidota bacterium]
MGFHIDRRENCAILTVEAEKFDTKVAPAIKAQLVLLKNEGFRNIIINLRQCRYCDSSGLSAILIANRICNENNGTCVICHTQKAVEKLIEISQLDTVLKIVPTLDEALQYINLEEVEKKIKNKKK